MNTFLKSNKRSLIQAAALFALVGAALAFPQYVSAEVLGAVALLGSITEGRHAGEFIMSEANGQRSRENVTIVSGQVLGPGQVLGKISSGGKYTAINQGAGDGSETAAGILIGACDASGGDVEAAIIARDAEVNGNCLDWGAESDLEIDAGIVELEALDIQVR